MAAGIVVAFVLFGQALAAVGGDRFLTDLALVAMGRYRGGPAKVAVVSSTLFGTVSGSAVSNVVVDGALTIPMMKRAGYPPHLAAAIEAVASNGGQIMPPVMGAAAFLIAEYLGLPYGEVALAAAIPAALYYLALFVQVDLEAAQRGLIGLPRRRAAAPRSGPEARGRVRRPARRPRLHAHARAAGSRAGPGWRPPAPRSPSAPSGGRRGRAPAAWSTRWWRRAARCSTSRRSPRWRGSSSGPSSSRASRRSSRCSWSASPGSMSWGS